MIDDSKNKPLNFPTPVVSAGAVDEVKIALEMYFMVLQHSELSFKSQGTYFDMANNFVRWMSGDFVPGSRVAPYSIKQKDKRAS
jgi:hypothetical protein